MREVNYLEMNGNEQLLLGKITFFSLASIYVQAHYVYDSSIVWAAGVWFLCNFTVLNPWALISVRSLSPRSNAPFCPKQEHLIPLLERRMDLQPDHLYVSVHQIFPSWNFILFISILRPALDHAPLVFWLVFSPPALNICLTLAFLKCLSPKCVLIGGSPVNWNVIGVAWRDNTHLPHADERHYSCMLRAKHTHKCTHSLSYMFRCPTMFLPLVLLHRT